MYNERTPGTDQAPVDYTCMPSVAEGVRRERAQKIHRGGEALPSRPAMTPPQPLMPSHQEDYGIPDDPFHPPEETQRPRRSRAQRTSSVSPDPSTSVPDTPSPRPVRAMTGARTAVPVITAQDGSQFEAPVSPEVPEWLKVAQHNNTPDFYRPPAPRVQAAPRRAQTPEPPPVDVLGRPLHNRRSLAPQTASSVYEQAGYPEQLLDAQRRLEAEAAAQPLRRRHGAQYAVQPQYAPQPQPRPVQPQYAQSMPSEPYLAQVQPSEEAMMSRAYHRPKREEPQEEPYQVEDDEIEERTGILSRIPWLAIAAVAVVAAALILWILKIGYESQTQQILTGRAQQEAAILEAHPIRYTEILSDKANKYNLHPAFVAAIMLNESSFRPDATSSVNARGLMQLMDDTAGWIYEKMDDPSRPYDFDDLYNPEINAEYGCWYLRYLSDLFYGDPILVAAAFHAGQGEVRNWLNDSAYSKDGRSIRLEDMIDGPTKRYVTRVLNDFAAYKRLYFGG